jgi:hypothetical protein
MKYRVSEKYLKRKKIEPIFSSLWGLLLGSLVFGVGDVPWYVAVVAIVFMVGITGGSNWFGSKRIIESLRAHVLEIDGSIMKISDEAMSSEVDMASIHRLTLDKKKDKVISIYIERIKGQMEKLPPYENINALAETLVSLIPSERVKVRKWLHL